MPAMTDEVKTKVPRGRRHFTDQFKSGAVSLVVDKGKTIAEVSRDLDLTPSALSKLVTRLEDRLEGAGEERRPLAAA